MVIAQQPIKADTFADINTVFAVQCAEIVGRFGAGDPLQNAVGHFHQRHMQPFFRSNRRCLEANVATTDDQHAPTLGKLGGHRIGVLQITHRINTLQIATNRCREQARVRSRGQGKGVICHFLAPLQRQGLRCRINRHDPRAGAQGDRVVGVILGRAQIQPGFVHLAQQIGLG